MPPDRISADTATSAAGFGFFGFLGTLFFIFLVIALLRAVFGGGRGGWGRRGWGGGWGGPGGRYGHDAWSDRAREFHDELHRTGGETPKDPKSQDGGLTSPAPASAARPAPLIDRLR